MGSVRRTVELANWGVSYDPDVIANPFWVSKAQTDWAGFYRLIRDTVLAGGCGSCQGRPVLAGAIVE